MMSVEFSHVNVHFFLRDFSRQIGCEDKKKTEEEFLFRRRKEKGRKKKKKTATFGSNDDEGNVSSLFFYLGCKNIHQNERTRVRNTVEDNEHVGPAPPLEEKNAIRKKKKNQTLNKNELFHATQCSHHIQRCREREFQFLFLHS
jgi:hypothetical protein